MPGAPNPFDRWAPFVGAAHVARAGLLALMLVVAGCAGLPVETSERSAIEPASELVVPVTAELVDQVADLVATLENGRYEYFQHVVAPDGRTSGSDVVPLARGARSETGERLTAELGIDPSFAADKGTTTRLNVLAADGRVCMNVPFYQRVVDEAGPDENVAWMLPLVDGWGCMDTGDVVDASGVPSSALTLGDDNLYLRMVEVLRSAEVVSVETSSYRGVPVSEALVDLSRESVGGRFGGYADGASVLEAMARLRFAQATGEVLTVHTEVNLAGGLLVTEQLEIYGRGTVEPVELPEDATDITEPISQVLTD